MGLGAFQNNGIPIDDFITIPQEDCQYENPDEPSCWEWFFLHVFFVKLFYYSILIYFSKSCRYFKTNVYIPQFGNQEYVMTFFVPGPHLQFIHAIPFAFLHLGNKTNCCSIKNPDKTHNYYVVVRMDQCTWILF